MVELIDIAARTGLAPVRALFAVAVGSAYAAILQPHEVRYRNDQHHVLYGGYEDEHLIGLVGIARDPASTSVEIQHFATAEKVDLDEAARFLMCVLARQRERKAVWSVPDCHASLARLAGFREPKENAGDARWVRAAAS